MATTSATPTSTRRRSSATWLTLVYLSLVVFASLYPFGPWRWPPGLELEGMVRLPWPKYFGPFDIQANLVGYMPLGFLAFAAALRSGRSWRAALLWGLLPWPLLSFAMELLQYFLPRRVPSLLDWALNTGGAWLGTAIGVLLARFGNLRRWQDLSDYWFQPHSAGALALLALWPLGLLFPPPLPLGLGQWLPRLQNLAEDALEGTPWVLLWTVEGVANPDQRPLLPGLEAIATAMGLLAPVLLALTVARPGFARRGTLVLGAWLLGLTVTTLSTALNFGPQHAWAWLTAATVPGLIFGALLCLPALMLPRRVCAALGLVVLCVLIALVTQAPADPYLAQRLQTWEQGRFINMYGLAQWIGWVWPFAALGWLLSFLGRRNP